MTRNGAVAARRAHNPKVAGSNPASATKFNWPLGQAVKTPPFHGGNRGSIPLGVTKKEGSDTFTWEYSSAGRAPALQAGGHRFDPCYSHHFFKTSCIV